MPLTGEFRPSAVLGAISRAKNEMLDPTFLSEHAANHRERTIARLATRYQERLRKSNALDFDDLLLEAVRLFDEAPRRAGQVPGALALPPRRRVPGHEPRAIPVGQGARGQAPQPVRGRRRRPVDLLVARRGPAQHPRLRARLAGHRGRQARAELPLDPADPRRRPRRRVAQHRPQGQEAVDRQRRRRPDPALRGLQRGGGGRVDRPPGRGPGRRSRDRADPTRGRGGRPVPGARDRGHVPDERPVAGDRGIVPPLRHPLPARRRDAVLLAARGQGRPGLPAHPALGHRQRQLRADHQRAGPGHRREDDRGAAGRRRARGRHDLGRHRSGGRGRAARSRAAHPQRAGRVRGPRPAAAHAGSAS